jgi:hypothetical protein
MDVVVVAEEEEEKQNLRAIDTYFAIASLSITSRKRKFMEFPQERLRQKHLRNATYSSRDKRENSFGTDPDRLL